MRTTQEYIRDVFFQPIRINKTFWVAMVLLCSLSAGAFGLYKAVRRVGKPFQGFFVGGNLMVSVGQRAPWPGMQAGLKPLDKILGVNGVSVRTVEEFKSIVGAHHAGQIIRYKIERGDQTRIISVPMRQMTALDFLVSFLAPFSIGLIFITLGAVTIFYVSDLRVSYLYFTLCSLIGIFCLVFNEAYTSHTFFRVVQIYPLIAAVAVHLFAVFPETRKISEARLVTIIVVYISSILLVILRQYFLYNRDASIVLSKVSSFFVGCTLLLNLILLVDTVLKAKTNVTKDKAKVFIAGVIIASSAVGLWSANYVFKRASFYLDEAILISLVFPIFMTYAIIKKNVFDIDRVIRISLTYAVSTGIVILGYFVIIAMVGFFWPGFLRTHILIGVFAFLAILGAFIFNPLKRRTQILIYKMLFKAKYDRLQTLMKYGKRLSSSVHIDQISDILVSDLVGLMDLKGAALVTYLGETADAPEINLQKGMDAGSFDRELDRKNSKLVSLLAKYDKPQPLGYLRTVRTSEDVERLKSLGVRILVPIKSKNELLGILLLQDKKSLDVFTAEDLEFLGALSAQAAVSLENANLYIEKARQERLAALGEVASVIIHEVKNPLGVIKVSAGTIKRKFDEGESAFELATFIEKEVSRMNNTIQQILNFSKPKENRLEKFSLDGLVLDTAKSQEHDFLEAGIKLVSEVKGGEIIVADRGKIRRALINLLTNAKEATKKGGTVSVRAGTIGGDDTSRGNDIVEIEVGDDGEGINEENMHRIFKPFFTTKQEGTGLGLAIVRQIAQDHDGDVEVFSEKGRGSRFTLRFLSAKTTGEKGEGQWKAYTNKEF